MQKFKFIMETLRVTQGYGINSNGSIYYDSFSHAGSYALDLGGENGTTNSWMYAPCDIIVKRHYRGLSGYNAVWFETINEVMCADGKARKLVLLCIHANDSVISELGITVGKTFNQGDKFYREGSGGGVHSHVHIEVGLAPFREGGWYESEYIDNSNGKNVWIINDKLMPNEVFIVGDDVVISNDGGYSWVKESEFNNMNNNVIYGVDISSHQSKNAVESIIKKGKASFIITRNSYGSYTPDKNLYDFMEDINSTTIKNSAYVASYAKDEKDAIEEANFLVEMVKKYNNEPELPLFFDWEYFSADYIEEIFGIKATKDLVQKITVAFCERIKELGYEAGVYSNLDFIQRFYTKDFWEAHPDYKLWYARPGLSKPDKECFIWQYASNNGLNDFGYDGDIDKNILYGEFSGEIDPMKPLSKDPIRMYIGFASSGDIHTLVVKINGLGISTTIKNGYIITSEASSGDQCYIMMECNRLGVPYKIYEENGEESYMRIKIGFASSGDIWTIEKKLKELNITDYIVENGYITTNSEITYGDFEQIKKLCDSLSIPCVEFSEKENCEDLKNKIKELNEEIYNLKLALRSANDNIFELEKENEILEEKVNNAISILNS